MNKKESKNSGREQQLINLKKARSSLTQIIQMVEEDKYCVDVMQQNLAVIGILKSFHQMILNSHLKSCFSEVMKHGTEKKKDEMIEEILKVTKISK
jgi:DNA-binding FrmR family transcriptional regulator